MPERRVQVEYEAADELEALYYLQQSQQQAAPDALSQSEAAPQVDMEATPIVRYLASHKKTARQGSKLMLLAVVVTLILEVAVGFTLWPVSLVLGLLYGTLGIVFWRRVVPSVKQIDQIIREADLLLRHPWLSWVSIGSSGLVALFMLWMAISVGPNLFVGSVGTALVAHFLLATGLMTVNSWAGARQWQQLQLLRRKRKRDG